MAEPQAPNQPDIIARHMVERRAGRETAPNVWGLFDKSLTYLNNKTFPAKQTEAELLRQRGELTKYVLQEMKMDTEVFMRYILHAGTPPSKLPPEMPLFAIAALDLKEFALSDIQTKQLKLRMGELLGGVYDKGQFISRKNNFYYKGEKINNDVGEVAFLRGLAENGLLNDDSLRGKNKTEIAKSLYTEAAQYKTAPSDGTHFQSNGIDILDIGSAYGPGGSRMPLNDYRLNVHFDRNIAKDFKQKTESLATALDMLVSLGYPTTVKVTDPDDAFTARYCVYCDIPTARKILNVMSRDLGKKDPSVFLDAKDTLKPRHLLYPFGVKSGICLRTAAESGAIQNLQATKEDLSLLHVQHSQTLSSIVK